MQCYTFIPLSELRDMLATGHTQDLQKLCTAGHPAALAELMTALSVQEAWAVLEHADALLRAEIFSHLGNDLQVEKVILRHANLSTTQRYLGKVSDTEAIRWIENIYR